MIPLFQVLGLDRDPLWFGEALALDRPLCVESTLSHSAKSGMTRLGAPGGAAIEPRFRIQFVA